MPDDEKPVYVIEFDLPGTVKGQDVQVAGLGTFKNGSSYDVSKEEADSFRSYNTRQEFDHDEEGRLVVEAVPGPTLLQAFEHTVGVTVTTAQSSNNPPPAPPKPPEDDKKKGGDE